MLIRFVLDNVYSFGKQKEFTMIPNSRLRTLENHVVDTGSIELLKLSSIYGANAAGKSNLVKGLDMLRTILVKEQLPVQLSETVFCFQDNLDEVNQVFAVEFVEDKIPYYYGMIIKGGVIIKEELYLSGLGVANDELIFERTTDEVTELRFSDEFEKDEKSQILKSVLLEDFIKPTKPVLNLLSRRDNKHLEHVRNAYNWFAQTLQIVSPTSRPVALAHKIDVDSDFRDYANTMMCSFNLGVSNLRSESMDPYEFFGQDNDNELEEILRELEESSSKMLGLRTRKKDELIMVKEGDDVRIKQLVLEHEGRDGRKVEFELDRESDGTIRMLEFIPAFRDVTLKNKVYIIDELERSIHPLLAKELVQKFSFDNNTNGQLIFTTHESNLLDQSIFRQDEIWFVEKDLDGSTDLYSLSDFKEHKTIDIRKGYLNGRYGSIPFIGNLRDLNWHGDDTNT